MEFDLNWLAVLVAVIAHQAIGFFWYGVLFSKLWMDAAGKTPEDVSGGPGGEMVIGIVGSVLSALALALILTLPDEVNAALGVAVGAVGGIGFAAASIYTAGAYEDRPPKLSLIFSGYQVVGFMVMGAILGAWR